jgi:putative resolvase
MSYCMPRDRESLARQCERLESFAVARGYKVLTSAKEHGSGLNDHRPKLSRLLSRDDWSVLVVEHDHRLIPFGFNYVELLLAGQGRRVEVINASEAKEDLMEDFVSVITSFLPSHLWFAANQASNREATR